MAKTSAGLLPFRWRGGRLEVFLVHHGGPFWAKKDDGAWSIPKGETEAGESLLEVAVREFLEETGFAASGPFTDLETVRQSGGKVVQVWSFQGDFDPARLRSNEFLMEWPPRSGRMRSFPEVDRGAWFDLREARCKILKGQTPFLDRLAEKIPFPGP